jgi:hypothetical protein
MMKGFWGALLGGLGLLKQKSEGSVQVTTPPDSTPWDEPTAPEKEDGMEEIVPETDPLMQRARALMDSLALDLGNAPTQIGVGRYAEGAELGTRRVCCTLCGAVFESLDSEFLEGYAPGAGLFRVCLDRTACRARKIERDKARQDAEAQARQRKIAAARERDAQRRADLEHMVRKAGF